MNHVTASPKELQSFRVALGAEIREQRGVMAASQGRLAHAARVTQACISNYENGKRDMPLSVALAIATVLFPHADFARASLAVLLERAERRLERGHPADRSAA